MKAMKARINLAPQILDQEKRIEELRKEVKSLSVSIRNLELKSKN